MDAKTTQEAARYRWLRASTMRDAGTPAICIISFDGYHTRISRDEADRRIDEAIAKERARDGR